MKTKMQSYRIPVNVIELLQNTVEEYKKSGLYNTYGLISHIVVNGIKNECENRMKQLKSSKGEVLNG